MAMNRKITESYLRGIAQLAKQKDLAARPPASELKGYHKFSERFEKKIAEIYAMLDAPKSKNKAARRVLLVAAIIILLIVFAMSVGAIRERIYELFLQHEDDHAVGFFVTVQQEDGSYIQTRADLSILYYPSYLPDGFSEMSHHTDDYTSNSTVYTNPQGERIVFVQEIINTYYGIDTDDTEYFEVNDDETIYYVSQKNGSVTVIWNQDGYAFVLFCELSVDEAIKIAQSLIAQ